MEAVFWLVGAGVCVAALRSAKRRLQLEHRTKEIWSASAKRLFYQLDPLNPKSMVGKDGDFEVRVEIASDAEFGDHTSITVRALKEHFGFSLRSRKISEKGVKTGDHKFDRLVVIKGPELRVRALLSHRVRFNVKNLIESYFGEIQNNQIFLRRLRPESTTQLCAWVQFALDVARPLQLGEMPLETRIRETLYEETELEVRQQLFQILLRRLKGEERTQMLHEMVLDPWPALRLRAAIELKEDGLGALENIYQDPVIDGEVRVAALIALTEITPQETAMPLLIEALSSDCDPLALGAAERLGNLKYVEALSPMIRGAEGRPRSIKAGIIKNIGRLASVDAEAFLIEQLKGPVEVAVAAANALGTAGSVNAVAHLKALGASERRIREATKNAVTRIQNRAGLGKAGAISLAQTAEDKSGALSQIADEAGALSEAPGSPGAFDSPGSPGSGRPSD